MFKSPYYPLWGVSFYLDIPSHERKRLKEKGFIDPSLIVQVVPWTETQSKYQEAAVFFRNAITRKPVVGVVARRYSDHISLIEVVGGKNLGDDPAGEDLLLHYTTTWEGLHPLLKEAGWPEIKCNMGEIGRQIKFLLYNTVTAKLPA